MAFRVQLPVRFGDIDQAGIVYYPRFFHLFHVAFEEFFREQVGVPYDQVLGRMRIGFPTVHIDADFQSPLKYGDHVDIELSVVKIGGHSVTCRYQALRAGSGELCATAQITTATVDMGSFKPTELTDALKAAFEKHRVSP
jgi:4-hydroxybenzoyl-CoA thioesterase